MNLSCVNEYLRTYAERQVNVVNQYIKTMYTPNFIASFKRDCYFMLINTLSQFNFTISGDTSLKYHGIIHIYAFLKSQVLASYTEITFQDIIDYKLANQIHITIDEYIGLYVYSINQHLINSLHYNLLLSEYNIKLNVQATLMDKIRFKLLIQDYHENTLEYENNPLDRLLRNTDFATYFEKFIC
jgi:hypothetical protein